MSSNYYVNKIGVPSLTIELIKIWKMISIATASSSYCNNKYGIFVVIDWGFEHV